MNKPYVISCASRSKNREQYEKSISKLKDSAELVAIWFDDFPGCLYRFDPLPDMKLDPERWWVFTDYGDVVFQTPIPDLDITKHEILVADERQMHSNSYWPPFILIEPIFTPLLACTCYNAGTVAMKGYLFLEYIKYLQKFREKLKDKSTQVYEMLIFNMWIQEHKYEIAEHPTLFTTLACNIDARRVKFVNGKFVNAVGEPYTIIHANGDTKGWFKLINK